MGKINEKREKKLVKNVINKNIKSTKGLDVKKNSSNSISKQKKDVINSTIKKITTRNPHPPISSVKKAEYAAKAEAKAARIKIQKAKRLEKTIIISKKTRRGQPLMKDRINFLLKKIQDSKNC